MSHPLSQRNALTFSHMGFYVRDLERMTSCAFLRRTVATWAQFS
jgi:hypothetical protein